MKVESGKMLTSPLAIQLRSFTRALGLNKLIAILMGARDYEDRFGPALSAEVRLGDTVWDVGANVGLYTTMFVKVTGPRGRVVAFEPTQACFGQLEKKFSGMTRVVLNKFALGDTDGSITMAVETDPLAATHRVVSGSPAEQTVLVEIRSGASVVSADPEIFPNVIKIDVEGHEGAVIDGLKPLLDDHRLHCIGIEVHFGILAERGESWRPKSMEQILVSSGFTLRWTDVSHLLATR